MSQKMQQREGRFRSPSPTPPVQIRVSWNGEQHTGGLCDVSSHGLRISLTVNAPAGTEMELRVDVNGTELFAHAVARWSTPTLDGFMIGCALREAVPQSMLEGLVRSGQLEQRCGARKHTDISVQVGVELDGGQRNLARIVDYSADGFRLDATFAVPPGKRLLIEHEVEGILLRVPARAVWQTEEEGRFTVGCCLLRLGGATALERIVKTSTAAHTSTDGA